MGASARSRHLALQTTRARLEHTGARGVNLDTLRGTCSQVDCVHGGKHASTSMAEAIRTYTVEDAGEGI